MDPRLKPIITWKSFPAMEFNSRNSRNTTPRPSKPAKPLKQLAKNLKETATKPIADSGLNLHLTYTENGTSVKIGESTSEAPLGKKTTTALDDNAPFSHGETTIKVPLDLGPERYLPASFYGEFIKSP